ncbi:hypothetical protein H5P28_10680 [Ruficoccus amylovorans]|uniref:PAS domain-containing protein n=1 Tax=Ruficoccus amylovorans TaxID=1804625 RepID=A0A842HDU5_9BACT|nr:PAS domain-containing protein [Ruficoccus amylovorans]MBC2594725.1 hypothetical protein [Ruficoccus amylovorans]
MRSSKESIRQEASRIERLSHLRRVIEVMPGAWLILNRHRQVVFANRTFSGLLDMASDSLFGGLRIGEILGCQSSTLRRTGCGTAPGCDKCAITTAVDKAFEGEEVKDDCRLRIANGSNHQLCTYQITTRPVETRVGRYVLLSLLEVSS